MKEDGERYGAAALDAVTDGLWEWDLRTGQVSYSDRWLESLGYERSELPSGPGFVTSITHPEDRELLTEVGRSHLAGQTDYFECEYRLRRKSGEYRWTLGRGRVLERDAAGKALRVLVASYDITARKAAEQALEQAEGRCRAIVDTTGCVILCLDSNYRILEWNPAAEKLYGWTRTEVLGKNYVEWFLPEEVRDRVTAEIQRVLAGENAENYPNPVITRDGSEKQVLWNATCLVGGDGEAWGVVAIGQDITELRQAERQREIAFRELEVMAERVQGLRGLLAICAGCHRVQGQDGGWSRLEEILGTPVELAPGRCPDCAGRDRSRPG